MSLKFLAQGNDGLLLTGFEPMQPAILGLLVRCVNHSTMLPRVTEVTGKHFKCEDGFYPMAPMLTIIGQYHTKFRPLQQGYGQQKSEVK